MDTYKQSFLNRGILRFMCVILKHRKMNRIILLVFVVLFFSINCSKTVQEELATNKDISHIEYFGFAITDCGIVNQLESIDDFVNLVDIVTRPNCPNKPSTIHFKTLTIFHTIIRQKKGDFPIF